MSNRYMMVFIICVLCACLAGGCTVSVKPPGTTESELAKITSADYPEFTDDMIYDGLEHGILQSISYLNNVPATKEFRFEKDVFDTAHMIKSLEYFLKFIKTKPSGKELNKFIRSNYLVYKSAVSENPGHVLFTGYYEPFLEGSLEKSDEYKFPIYARPKDLMTINLSLFSPRFNGETIVARYDNQAVVPYYDRENIEYEDILEGRASHIAWLKDKVDLFFLQIQGSGKIFLDNGDIINVHYHTSNGRPYRSIGKLLVDMEKIDRSEMSMQRIRSYLRDYPEEVEDVLNYNPSYVFFKTEDDGPLGYLNVRLTPGRSIALDRRIFPMSGLAYIETQKPVVDGDGEIHEWIDFSRFVLIQDTGGAIRGPGRADLFWGNGMYAEIAAGHMQHPGTLYLFILKPDVKIPALKGGGSTFR